MGKYLKLFDNHSQYETYTADTSNFILPNVSLCVNENEVHYNPLNPTPPTPSHDYSQDYLTFVALEDSTFKFSGSTNNDSIDYSLNNGETWESLGRNISSPTITSGNKILWKGNLTPTSHTEYDEDAEDYETVYDGIGTFSSTGNFTVEGNIMSLLYGDNFLDQTSLSKGTFTKLFTNCTKMTNAENLALLASIAKLRCYQYMFRGCTNLTAAPSLPATTLEGECYVNMFRDCTNLTVAPELPATTVTSNCYNSMFRDCTSLTTAPQLPATTLAYNCYSYMFYGCTSLNYIKAMFTTVPSTSYMSNWVSGVASSGTFVKNSAATWTFDCGNSTYPCNWAVEIANS